MKALLIDPQNQTIAPVQVDSLDDIRTLIGYDTLAIDAVGSQGDRLFFDEECFLRGTSGRFQLDTLVPVAGKGVVVNASDDGDVLADVIVDGDELAGRVRYL